MTGAAYLDQVQTIENPMKGKDERKICLSSAHPLQTPDGSVVVSVLQKS